MKVARWFGLGLLGVAVLGAVLVAATLWNFYIPSADAKRLSALYAARPRAPDADNAYFYAWGLTAAADVDPLVEAARRLAWIRRKAATPGLMEPDPGTEKLAIGERRSDSMRRLARDCSEGATRQCAAAFEQWPLDAPLSAVETRQAARYAELLKRPRWAESVPVDGAATLPPYAEVLDGQRVELLQLRAAAAAGDAQRVRDTLDHDFAFWREVQKSSDSLITKMIACAAIRNHFFFGNLLLRALPPAQRAAAIPPSWRVPMSTEERSMLRVLAGEYEFSRLLVESQQLQMAAASEDGEDFDEDSSSLEAWLAGLGGRLRPWQRDLNIIASVYIDSAAAFSVPLNQYVRAAEALELRIPPRGVAMNVSGYAERVGALEGVRRAALLTAELRGRGVPADLVASELAAPAPGNPFTDEPFEWNAEQQAVIFEGIEDHRWNRHAFFY